jgi:hypothetical protein
MVGEHSLDCQKGLLLSATFENPAKFPFHEREIELVITSGLKLIAPLK